MHVMVRSRLGQTSDAVPVSLLLSSQRAVFCPELGEPVSSLIRSEEDYGRAACGAPQRREGLALGKF